MEDVKRIYSLLLDNNGLKIREIAKALGLDKLHVAEIMYSDDSLSYWFNDDESRWFAKEGAIPLEEKKDRLYDAEESYRSFNTKRFQNIDSSDSLRYIVNEIPKFRIYSDDEKKELFKRYNKGDYKAFEALVKGHLGLVANLAFLYRQKGAPLEDLIQEGTIGLIKAIERFNYQDFNKFEPYAKAWILQSISHSLTYIPYLVRISLNSLSLHRKIRKISDTFEQENGYPPSINDLGLDEDIAWNPLEYVFKMPDDLRNVVLIDNDLDSYESNSLRPDYFEKEDLYSYYVHGLLHFLKEKDAQMVCFYYGIGTNMNGESRNLTALDELIEFGIDTNLRGISRGIIGQYFGLTGERVRQRVEKSIHVMNKIGIKKLFKNIEESPYYSVLKKIPIDTPENVHILFDKRNKIGEKSKSNTKRTSKSSNTIHDFDLKKQEQSKTNETRGGSKYVEKSPRRANKRSKVNKTETLSSKSSLKRISLSRHAVDELDGFKVGDFVYYKGERCEIIVIVVYGTSSRFVVKYANGVHDAIVIHSPSRPSSEFCKKDTHGVI